jgi:hypothetical protein
MIDYDAELQFHNERLRAAYDIHPADQRRIMGVSPGG